MKEIVIYGAGEIGKNIIPLICNQFDIIAIIDRDASFYGKKLFDIPVISIDDYIEKYSSNEILIALNAKNMKSAIDMFTQKCISNYKPYYEYVNPSERGRRKLLISSSDPSQLEDVILYNVFSDYDEIFYIDVGCNDPIINSVTRLLYDTGKAHGINIDPIKEIIDITDSERTRDINICCGIGNSEGYSDFYVQGGLSSILEENIRDTHYSEKRKIKITTLKSIYDAHLSKDQEISFLKIDVEGFEREVLEGAALSEYRPHVIVMEATLPGTDIPCYDKWEYILSDNKYHFVFSYGVNRYYVSDEHKELDARFIPIISLLKKYKILSCVSVEKYIPIQ